MSFQEFRDALHLRYGLTPPNLPTLCDACTAPFTVTHALTCSIGGLIYRRHHELRDELASIAAEAFSPSAVTIEPPIHPG
ncbi:MAG TPA: hypothetical protein V6D20_15030, partial [Candidatus Obscuribacterales bacterium]